MHTLSCSSGALSRFFHAASRFELHLNCPLAGGKFVWPHRCGGVLFWWALVYFVSVDTSLRFISYSLEVRGEQDRPGLAHVYLILLAVPNSILHIHLHLLFLSYFFLPDALGVVGLSKLVNNYPS